MEGNVVAQHLLARRLLPILQGRFAAPQPHPAWPAPGPAADVPAMYAGLAAQLAPGGVAVTITRCAMTNCKEAGQARLHIPCLLAVCGNVS